MRFTITEKTEQEAIDETREFIQKNCQQFLREVGGKRIYRGVKSSVSKKLGQGTEVVFIANPPQNRMPVDTPIDLHKYADDLFLKLFGWRARSSAVFGTGLKSEAELYGTAYKIYPTDGYKYLWSPNIKDLFMDLDHFMYGRAEYRYVETPVGDDEIKEHIEDIVRTYKNTDLVEAIDFGHEIMISCDKYAAVWWNANDGNIEPISIHGEKFYL
jgi:hypothetical protein